MAEPLPLTPAEGQALRESNADLVKRVSALELKMLELEKLADLVKEKLSPKSRPFEI